jgi:hypothetical protein
VEDGSGGGGRDGEVAGGTKKHGCQGRGGGAKTTRHSNWDHRASPAHKIGGEQKRREVCLAPKTPHACKGEKGCSGKQVDCSLDSAFRDTSQWAGKGPDESAWPENSAINGSTAAPSSGSGTYQDSVQVDSAKGQVRAL